MADAPDLTATLLPVIADGMACSWQPGMRPSDGRLAMERVLELLIAEPLNLYGFNATVKVRQLADGTRELGLLGPDSPGEYVTVIRPEELASERLERTAVRLARWIDARGQEYHRLEESRWWVIRKDTT